MRFSRIEEITMKFFPIDLSTTFLTILVALLSPVSKFAFENYSCIKQKWNPADEAKNWFENRAV